MKKNSRISTKEAKKTTDIIVGEKEVLNLPEGTTIHYQTPAQKEEEKRRKEEEKRRKRLESQRGIEHVRTLLAPVLTLDISLEALGHLVDLARNMSMTIDEKHGYLITAKGGKSKTKATQSDIEQILDIGTESFYELMFQVSDMKITNKQVLENMQGKLRYDIIRVVKKGRRNEYYMNPEYFARGAVAPGSLFIKIYFKEFDLICKEFGLSSAEKGFLVKISEYFHVDEYRIVENPFETNPNELLYMDKDKIAEKLEMDFRTVEKYIEILKDKCVIHGNGGSRFESYIINPLLIFRKDVALENKDHTEWVIRSFEGNKKAARKKLEEQKTKMANVQQIKTWTKEEGIRELRKMIEENPTITNNELAEFFEVNRRTVIRWKGEL